MAKGDIEDAYRVYFPLIREKCSRMLRDPADAQDIAQETFVRLWKHRGRIVERCSMASWLYLTSTRLAIDLLRQRKRRPAALMSDDSIAGPAASSPGDRLDAARQLERLAAATPKKELEAAILSRVDGLSHAEIGALLATSERTVRRRLRSFDERIMRLTGQASAAAEGAAQ